MTSKLTTIRSGAPADAPVLTEIAHAAKRHWGYPEHWIAAWKDALTITEDFISNNDVYVACVEGEITGFAALVTAGSRVWIDHLWVSPEHIGTGVGRALFTHAAGVAASTGAPALEIESDPNAEGFYKQMGARRVGEQVSEIDGAMRVVPLLVLDLSRNPLHFGKA